MLTTDGGEGDTPLQIFTQNTMPLCHSGLFSHNLWDTCAGARSIMTNALSFISACFPNPHAAGRRFEILNVEFLILNV